MSANLRINDVLCEDVLVHIFSFLSTRSIVNCSKTCKRWRAIAGQFRFWQDLAVQMDVDYQSRRKDLNVAVSEVFNNALAAIKEVKDNQAWRDTETPSWLFLVYDRKILRYHSNELQDLRNQKWNVKEAHKDKLLQAFKGYLGFYYLGLKKEEQAFDAACRLKEVYQVKQPLERLSQVHFEKGNMRGAIQVALSFPKEADQATHLLRVLEYFCEHNQKKQAENIWKMIPPSCNEQRNRAAELLIGG